MNAALRALQVGRIATGQWRRTALRFARRARVLAAALLCLTCLSGTGSQAADPQFAYGFDAMEHPELLPFFLPNGTQTKQFITYDPAGKNRVGFFKRYEDDGEYVFFDEIGPGCLYRQQMNVFSKFTQFPNEKVRIRYYFDDEPKPRIDMTFAEFFGKGGKYSPPFHPAAGLFRPARIAMERRAWGVRRALLSASFQKRLKVAAYQPGGMKFYEASWFQYTYLKYPPGTNVATWKGARGRFAAAPRSVGALRRGPERERRRNGHEDHDLHSRRWKSARRRSEGKPAPSAP